ncbi:hypothetical protein F4775DRAFT_285429 [Biscogniauxia sp. FL1348]|nr:hypothetical protein F4775DRAFT_285429 [Biscogniauxia sp. FL1348]
MLKSSSRGGMMLLMILMTTDGHHLDSSSSTDHKSLKDLRTCLAHPFWDCDRIDRMRKSGRRDSGVVSPVRIPTYYNIPTTYIGMYTTYIPNLTLPSLLPTYLPDRIGPSRPRHRYKIPKLDDNCPDGRQMQPIQPLSGFLVEPSIRNTHSLGTGQFATLPGAYTLQ